GYAPKNKNLTFRLPPKTVVEHARGALSATNPTVRQAAVSAVGTLYLFMGSKVRVLFENEKPQILQLIDAEFEKIGTPVAPVPTRGPKAHQDQEEDAGPSAVAAAADAASDAMEDLIPRTDISPQITEGLLSELNDKNWKVRDEALRRVASILGEAKFIKPPLGDLPAALKARALDTNKNLAATALGITKTLGEALGSNCRVHARTMIPPVLVALGDSKANVRGAAKDALEVWQSQIRVKDLFDGGEVVAEVLKTENPLTRAEVFRWLTEVLPDAKGLNREDLLACLGSLFSACEDRNPEVRKNAGEALVPVMIHLGYDSMAKAASRLKPASKPNIMNMLEKARQNLPLKPIPAEAPKGAAPGGKSGGTKGMAVKRPASGPGVRGGGAAGGSGGGAQSGGPNQAAAPAKTGKKDEEDLSPPLAVNNLKGQRFLDEKKLKILKWQFQNGPREDLVDQLKELLQAASINQTLHAHMFHQDFRYHLKALDTLMGDLPGNVAGLIANLDLVLKWLTIRFYDTNPSVILRGLEYLELAFSCLVEHEYLLADPEGAAFVPHLVIKLGDPKDAVRSGCRNIFHKMYSVYSSGKVFPYLLEGLRSKNGRQRSGCLEEMAHVIQHFGMSVFLGHIGPAMKEMARQISDRDSSVRNAALNAITQVYFIEGEKVHRMIGQIPEKDLSLLEERIKRASKSRPPPPPVAQSLPTSPQIPQEATSGSSATMSRPPRPTVTLRKEPEPLEVKPETEAPNRFRGGEEQPTPLTPTSREPEPKKVVWNKFPHMTPVVLPSAQIVPGDITDDEIEHLKHRRAQRPRATLPSGALEGSVQAAASSAELQQNISHTTSASYQKCLKALVCLHGIVEDNLASTSLVPHVEELVGNLSHQFHRSRQRLGEASSTESIHILIKLTELVMQICHRPYLIEQLRHNSLADLFRESLELLVDPQLKETHGGSSLISSLNRMEKELVNKSDPTEAMCALLQLVRGTLATGPPAEDGQTISNMLLKCIWKRTDNLGGPGKILHLEPILQEIHTFFVQYPRSFWKAHPEADKRLTQTMRSIIYTLIRARGRGLINAIAANPEFRNSEMQSYANKLYSAEASDLLSFLTMRWIEVSVLRDDERDLILFSQCAKRQETRAPSPSHLNHEEEKELSDIFVKLGNKNENSKEALSLLYDFRLAHPGVDLMPFLSKSSAFFQQYIKEGLEKIEKERRDSTMAAGSISSKRDPTELLRDIKSACAAPNKLHALKTLAERERIQPVTTTQALKQLENLLGATFPAEGDPDRLAYMKFAAQQKPLPMSSEGWRKMRESFLKKQQDGIYSTGGINIPPQKDSPPKLTPAVIPEVRDPSPVPLLQPSQDDEVKSCTVTVITYGEDLSNEEQVLGSPFYSKEYDASFKESISDPESFWGRFANDVEWVKPFHQVLDDSNSPFTKWFPGGEINVCYNALDRWATRYSDDHIAIIHDSPITETQTKITWKDLLKEVQLLSLTLTQRCGVEKGDRVVIYLPMIPQAVVAMLACARIGAVHCLVFGGFSAQELGRRIQHCDAKVVITADVGFEPNRTIDYKAIVDDSIAMNNNTERVSSVIVFKRSRVLLREGEGRPVPWKWGRDLDWTETLAEAERYTDFTNAPCVPVESNDPLYILYTSGTSGDPKGVVRPSGPHAVVLPWTMRALFDIQPGEPWWAASDLGWVVGHSYICYAPLLAGNTTVIYEGKPVGTPDSTQFFRVASEHSLPAFFTSPTALRVIKVADPRGEVGKKFDLSKLRAIFVAGEPLDHGTRIWAEREFGVVRIVRDEDGEDAHLQELGRILVKLPLPPGCFTTLWKADNQFRKIYFTTVSGYYDTQDAGTIDEHGYISVRSREDDVLKVAGHRLSSLSLEDAILDHPDVIDCAVVGIQDQIKGQVPVALYVVKDDCVKSESDLRTELIQLVREHIGPVAAFRIPVRVPALPRTRSGKTPRKALSDLANGYPFKLPVTLEDPSVFETIEKCLLNHGLAIKRKSDSW
ncbi:unnamed protein product, partial [Cyprideis torosa]